MDYQSALFLRDLINNDTLMHCCIGTLSSLLYPVLAPSLKPCFIFFLLTVQSSLYVSFFFLTPIIPTQRA